MKFIQSSNKENPIVNLYLIVSIEKKEELISLCTENEYINWKGNQEQLEKDWQTICEALNNDASSSNIIK